MIGTEFVISTIQASGGGIMVWGTFPWHTLGDLVPIKSLFKCRSLPRKYGWLRASVYHYGALLVRQRTVSQIKSHGRLIHEIHQYVFNVKVVSLYSF